MGVITLFVGGSHDGARLDIDEARAEVRLPVIASFAMGSITVETKEADIFKHELYKRLTFRGADDVVTVFALVSMTADDVLRALVKRYR